MVTEFRIVIEIFLKIPIITSENLFLLILTVKKGGENSRRLIFDTIALQHFLD